MVNWVLSNEDVEIIDGLLGFFIEISEDFLFFFDRRSLQRRKSQTVNGIFNLMEFNTDKRKNSELLPFRRWVGGVSNITH